MKPDDVSVREGLFDFTIVIAEPLRETGTPAPAAPHFQEVIRRAQPETNQEQNIINKAHRQCRKKINQSTNSIGSMNGRVNLKMYPKNDGVWIFCSWAMDFTMKFGP